MDSDIGGTGFFIVTSVSLFLGWFLWQWILFNFRGFPKGPIGLPLIGYLGFFRDKPYRVLVELSKKYGKVFSLYCGPVYTVVICEYELAKEILSHPAALSRGDEVFGFVPGRGGFAGVNGAEWVEQRRFCVFTMRNLGMGRGQWENLTQEHAAGFMEILSSAEGKPVDIAEDIILCLSSNNIALLIGRRLSKLSNAEKTFIRKVHKALSEHFDTSAISELMPWLSDFFTRFHIAGYHEEKETLNEFANMFRKEIENRMNSKDEEQSQDFIGCYLKEMEKQNATNKKHYFSVDNLVGTLIVLFFAGGDTTISSILWLLHIIASYPEIQKKVHDEIDEISGTNGHIGWDDRKRMPYTMATILEMERYATINRVFPPRTAEQTFECRGYKIPKGSRILVNSWAVMHDPEYWENPMEFIPERFIRNDGKDPTKTRGLSTFSFGRRNCPGDTIALMTIFIYFIAIMEKFQIKTPHGGMADLRGDSAGIVTPPVPQELCFIART